MASFSRNQSLSEFQDFNHEVYGFIDDRLYSTLDLLIQQQRFAMRSVKGIRKGDIDKLKLNLIISLSWLAALANRLHISIENEVWKRFPARCSYCGEGSCVCGKTKPSKRKKIKVDNSLKPQNIAGFQKMFADIYPPQKRTLTHAGVHLAEEMGEVSEAVLVYLGQHTQKQFDKIKFEIADYISCLFGVANSADIDVAEGLEKLFYKNCHICHKVPCACSFTFVANLKT